LKVSNPPPNSTYKYKVGGTLSPDDPAYIYVKRQADQELYKNLQEGEFCYVLNSRQMGKSSLCVRTMRRLQTKNMSCALIDIIEISDQDATPDQWYMGFLRRLLMDFEISKKINLQSWWREQEGLPRLQKLSLFIEKVLLVNVPGDKIFIFLDEIDWIISLDYSLDDFFTLLRFCYNQRAKNPAYNRIVFALFGVATPSSLIRDKSRILLNIGKAIELTGFKIQEAEPLAKGLGEKADNPLVVLREILHWTGGQPFLTQKLCQLIADSEFPIVAGSERERIEKLVRSQLIENWESESQDNQRHFRTIRDRILLNQPPYRVPLLKRYQNLLQKGKVTTNDSVIDMELRLSGLVVKKQEHLEVYNRIYQELFTRKWVIRQLKILQPNPPVWTVLLASLVIAAFLIGVRELGILQVWEFRAFDQLLRLRPPEKPDPRILVVEVTDSHLNEYGNPIPDAILAQAIETLESYQPLVIGLDIFRDRPVEPGHSKLAYHWQHNDHLIALCSVSNAEDPNKPGISPPQEVPANRIGFSDVIVDPDGVVRRHLLFMDIEADSPCLTRFSLSFRLAERYLQAKGIKPQNTPENHLKLGDRVFQPLEGRTGFYRWEQLGGYQLLLNYRSAKTVARRVKLTDILNAQIQPNSVKDRIILIGKTAPTDSDDFPTPYSAGQWLHPEMRGVIIQAQMVSQILTAVLDKRPLLEFLPLWGEVIWIWGWSLVGGLVAWRIQSGIRLAVVGGSAISTLYGICFVFLLQGISMPLVPSGLALIMTGGGVVIYAVYRNSTVTDCWRPLESEKESEQ